MKRYSVLTALLFSGLATLAHAERPYDFTDTARVISVRPIYERAAHPRRECWDEEVSERQSRRSGDRDLGGTVIGGIAGGLLGSQVGKGNGKTAAAAVGAVTGAVVGDRIASDDRDGGDRYRSRSVQRCREVAEEREEVSGYTVKYQYNGRNFTTRMDRDPGRTVRLGVTLLD
ncbi:MAG: glycine zipper 2TM domain-containing protein [Pseudomonadota bacterium]